MSMSGAEDRDGPRPKQPELPAETELALEPLRAALLAHARSEADRIRARAAADATAVLDQARADLEEELAHARLRGEAAARAVARRARGQLQRRSRGVVLRAQRTIYDELVDGAEEAVRRLLVDPLRRERLADSLRERLGGTTAISDTADGGLLARAQDGRLIDASVTVLVRDALKHLDLEDLWATAR